MDKYFVVTAILNNISFTRKCESAYDALQAILAVLELYKLHPHTADELMDILLRMKRGEEKRNFSTPLYAVIYKDAEKEDKQNG